MGKKNKHNSTKVNQELKTENKVKQTIVSLSEPPTNFSPEAYKKLVEHFEVEYIFTFLPLEEIVQNSRISKFYHKILRKDEFWQDIALHTFGVKFEKENLEQVKELMSHETLLEKIYISEGQFFSYKPVDFFKDKIINKIVSNLVVIYVITTDGLYTYQQNKGWIQIFSNIDDIVDIAVRHDNQYLNRNYDANEGIALTKDGKVYFLNIKDEKYRELSWKNIVTDESLKVKQVGITFRNNLILLSNGDLIEGYSTEHLKIVASNIKEIFYPGVVTNNNYFLFRTALEVGEKERTSISNVQKAYMLKRDESLLIQTPSGTVKSGSPQKQDYTQKLREKNEEISKFWVGSINDQYTTPITFKTKSKKFYVYDNNGYHLHAHLNDFPYSIHDLHSDDQYITIKGKLPAKWYESMLKEITVEKVALLKKTQEDSAVCSRCFKTYRISENNEKSCRFHESTDTYSEWYYDYERVYYKCCGREINQGCIFSCHK